MPIPSIITLILAIGCLGFAGAMYAAQASFSKNAKTAVGSVVGFAGKRALVKLRKGNRLVAAAASAFDPTLMAVGQKVTLQYLLNDSSHQRWDIRIVGKSGHGQNHVKCISFIETGVGIVMLLAALFIFIILSGPLAQLARAPGS